MPRVSEQEQTITTYTDDSGELVGFIIAEPSRFYPDVTHYTAYERAPGGWKWVVQEQDRELALRKTRAHFCDHWHYCPECRHDDDCPTPVGCKEPVNRACAECRPPDDASDDRSAGAGLAQVTSA